MILIDCGVREQSDATENKPLANTKTQFTFFAAHEISRKTGTKIFVTTWYHQPRVARTAAKNLPIGISYEVVGVPYDNFPLDTYKMVRGETKRIIAYSQKRDIDFYPR